jgi:hypothetical protein
MTLRILLDLALIFLSFYSLILTAGVVYLYLSIKRIDSESYQLAQILHTFMNQPEDNVIEGFTKTRQDD